MEGKIQPFQKSQPPGTSLEGRRRKGGSRDGEETGEKKQVFARSFAANVHTKWGEGRGRWSWRRRCSVSDLKPLIASTSLERLDTISVTDVSFIWGAEPPKQDEEKPGTSRPGTEFLLFETFTDDLINLPLLFRRSCWLKGWLVAVKCLSSVLTNNTLFNCKKFFFTKIKIIHWINVFTLPTLV